MIDASITSCISGFGRRLTSLTCPFLFSFFFAVSFFLHYHNGYYRENLSKSVEDMKPAYGSSRGYIKKRKRLVVIMRVFNFKSLIQFYKIFKEALIYLDFF